MKRTLIALGLSAGLAACTTEMGPGSSYGPPPPPPGPDASGFAWSQAPGAASIDGVVAYRAAGVPYVCSGSAALMPDGAYSRRRITNLYGSADRAALPMAVVRGRQATLPADSFSKFVRIQRCGADGHFRFEGLPPGGWFVIVAGKPADGPGDTIALMRRVQVGPHQQRQVTLQ